MTRRAMKAGAVIETLLILAGLGLLVKGITVGGAVYKFTHLAQATDGIVNGVTDNGFTVNVQFSPAAGEIYAFSQTGLVRGHPVGDHVPVLYDPANPASAAIDSVGALWFMPVVMGLPGFLSLVLGLRLRGSRNL